jgi:iron complex transport system permease protein
LSIQRGQVDAGRVVLIGVGVAAAANSLVAWMLVIGDVNDAGRAAAWLAGSLNSRVWSDAVPVGLAVLLLLPVAMMFNRDLSALVLGDDVASSLGVRVARIRLALLVIATVLAAMATAGAGPIAFVALVAPQIAQRLTRMERPPLLTTALLGALFVVLADLLARNGLQWLQVGPYELPVGVVTAAAGAPYLLHLIGRQQRGR